MEPEQLKNILEEHKLWLGSGGKQGAQAILRNADLLKSLDLQAAQLAGTDVGGAKLPPAIAESLNESLKHIAEATANAQKLFIAILGGCLYTWLTIGTTRDAVLITNSDSTSLPGIGATIPIVGFYWVAPLILVSLYFYFLLNLQRLWETLADLPAVFPDGRTLDKTADPWLLNGLVLAHVAGLEKKRPPLFRFQKWLSILLAWGIVPLTVLFVWARLICRHDWPITIAHIVLLALSGGFALMSYRLARRTLRHISPQPSRWWEFWKKINLCVFCLVFFIILCAFLPLSCWPINYVHEELKHDPSGDVFHHFWTPNNAPEIVTNAVYLVEDTVYRFSTAQLSGVDFSEKPANWENKTNQYPLVKGANLRRANLHGADARKSFLMNVVLSDANLRYTNLRFAHLERADLRSADLHGAYLYGAFLEVANVQGAHFEGADLEEANVQGVDFKGADLTNADFRGVDLSQATNLTQSQISSIITGINKNTGQQTILPSGLHFPNPKTGNP